MKTMQREEVEKTVYEAKPKLRELIDRDGKASYLAYLQSHECKPAKERDHGLDALFFVAYEHLVRKHFDARIASETKEEIKKHFFASTADHGGPLCHPFFANAFLARALVTKQAGRELVLTLPCSGVSLDNSSFPRGLFFHDNNLKPVRLHFKSLSERHDSVYSTPPYTKADIERVGYEIANTAISREQKNILTNLVRDIFDRESEYARSTYDEQMIRANWLLPKYIKGLEGVEHISVSQEMLAREIILLHLDTDSIVSSLLCDEKIQEAYEHYFDGIVGAHERSKDRGTFLFWGLEKGVRKQLIRSSDGWYDISGKAFLLRDKQAIKDALIQKKIYPSMALTFIVLSFVHGITTGGGFSQINYLDDLAKSFEQLCDSVGWKRRELPQTAIFTGELIVNVLEKDGVQVPATLIDTILYQDDHTQMVLANAFSKTSLEDAVLGMMPEYYKIVTGEETSQELFTLPSPTLHVRKETE